MAQPEWIVAPADTGPTDLQGSGVWALDGADPRTSTAYAVHDAKNMLGALQANAHWLRSMTETPAQAGTEALEVVSDMEDCCRRLAGLLEEALLSASGEPTRVSPEPVRLSSLAASAVHRAERRARLRGVEVRGSTGTDTTAMLDAPIVSRALDNLIANAVDHCRSGATISVDHDVRGEIVVFAVSDEGSGVPDDVRETLFLPYVTERQPLTADTGAHVGLGLPFCRAAAHAHGGDVSFENLATGGACFTMTLPLVRPPRLSTVPR